MPEYRVELENYCGPLDLLLYLVKRNEVDLNDIPIATLADQYLEYLRKLEQIDINLAGEFLVMAATLLEIKSQMIKPPQEEDDEGEGEGEAGASEEGISALDPRFELVQQLLAYKAFKDAAGELDERREDWAKRFAALPAKVKAAKEADESDPDAAPPIELDLEDIGVNDLWESFQRVIESIGQGPTQHEVINDDTPIGLHVEDIADRLTREGPMNLRKIFEGRRRIEMVGLFIATLELVRQRRVRVVQDKVDGEIELHLREDAGEPLPDSDGATDWRNPETGEIDYEWPSEQAKQRAERRARLRAERAKKRQFGKGDDDEDDQDIIDLDEDGEGEETERRRDEETERRRDEETE